MGTIKLLMKSIVFSTRSRRRFFTFVIVFSILSGATILLLSYFDNFSREGQLQHRGVVIKATGLDIVTLATAKNDIGVSRGGAEAVLFFKYVNFGTNLRIFSINPAYPWAFSEIKPNNLVAGNFPSGNNDVLVSENLLLELEDSQAAQNVFIFTRPGLGTTFKLGGSIDSTFDLTVTGIYSKPSSVASDTLEWMFISENAFNTLIGGQNLGYTDSQIFIHSVSLIAAGDVFFGEAYDNVDILAKNLEGLGGNYESPDFTQKTAKDDQRNMMLLSLLFGMFGTFLVSTLYSYLITRFRRREVAVLKAMGYSKWNVRTVVLSEILVVAITGFFIGLLAIQGYIYLFRQGSYFYQIMFSFTAFLAFLAVVVSSVPGFIMITTRTLAVRPIELFRQK